MKKPCPACRGSGFVIDYDALGKKLKRRRIAEMISVETLADRMGYTRSYIWLLEQGKRTWTELLCEQYERALSSVKLTPLKSHIKTLKEIQSELCKAGKSITAKAVQDTIKNLKKITRK